MRHALSAKAQAGELIVWSDANLGEAKTKVLRVAFMKNALENVLIVDGAQVNENFALAARNLPKVDLLPVQGANVYDIMRRGTLVLTKAAVEALEARFK
jgi:large subunit ribosomal protein L4